MDDDEDDQDEFHKQLAEAVQDQALDNHVSDEEFARQVHEELDDPNDPDNSPTSSILSPRGSYYHPQPSNKMTTIDASSTPVFPEVVELDHSIIMDNPPDASYLRDVKMRALYVKILSIVNFLFSVYGFSVKIWWLGFGMIVAPVGFWGAKKFDRRITTIYIGCLCFDLFAQLGFTFNDTNNTLVVVLSMLIMAIQVFIVWYVFQFYKVLPKEGTQAFEEFRNPPQIIALQPMNTGV